jgi:hypothetical protein
VVVLGGSCQDQGAVVDGSSFSENVVFMVPSTVLSSLRRHSKHVCRASERQMCLRVARCKREVQSARQQTRADSPRAHVTSIGFLPVCPCGDETQA